MSLLQYTSDEMFSATDLVRKNKLIFDKLQKKEIEKAVILRDGKPSIIMIDFIEYEKLMKDYLSLKGGNFTTNLKTNQSQNLDDISINIKPEESKKIIYDEKINQDEYKTALEEIEKIGFSQDFSINSEEEKNSQPLKEFWEK